MGAAQRVWDEAKHPRGFGGKFASSAGGSSGKTKKTARQLFASADHAALHEKTVVQLRQDAKTAGLKGHSRSRKADLIDALVTHKNGSGPQKSARDVMQAKPAAKPLERKATSHGVMANPRDVVATVGPDSPGVRDYQDVGLTVNSHLRGRQGTQRLAEGRAERIVKELDSTFDNAPRTTAETVLWRGVSEHSKADIATMTEVHRALFGDESAVGKTFTDPAYGSTSASEAGAASFGHGANGVMLKVTVPKGSKALAFKGNLDREDEVLLPRGYSLRITKDEPGVGPDRVRHMEAVLVESPRSGSAHPKPATPGKRRSARQLLSH